MATYVVSGSRAGIGSVVVADGGSNDAFMLAGVGTEYDLNPSINASPAITGVSGTGQAGIPTTSTGQSSTLPSVTATGQIGSFAEQIDLLLAAVSATAQVGSLTNTAISSRFGFFFIAGF